jgi:hypothetical protein
MFTRTKRKAFTGLIVLIFGFFQAVNGQKLKTANYAGVYSFGKNVETGPVGSVTIFPETDTTVLFYIDICKGAPSYNLGQLYSRMKMINGEAVFYTKLAFDEKGCKWKLTISNRILTIKTLDDCYECGFGSSVYADNQYALKERKMPVYFVDGHNHKIYFSKTKPEDYER